MTQNLLGVFAAVAVVATFVTHAEPCVCPAYIDPVCGVDGKPYSNRCSASCAGVEVECKGHCPCPCTCTKEYDPVCGLDRATYGNNCEAQCADVIVACSGECPCPCICSQEYEPVCGVDGKTYRNQCNAGHCNGVEVACKGECPCPCVCTEEHGCDCEDPKDCLEEGATCNAFAAQFPDAYPNNKKCCFPHFCCPECSTGSDGLTVTPANGKCLTFCPECD